MWGHAVAPFSEAFTQVRRLQRPRLALEPFQPDGCLDLEVEVKGPLDALVGTDGDSAERLQMLQQLLAALQEQHHQLLYAFASSPRRGDWATLRALRFLVHDTAPARQAALAAVQDQRLTVQLGDTVVALPVRPVAGRLPPGHVQVELHHVPEDCARQGVCELVLAAAGYRASQGVTVQHERRGGVRGPTGLPQPLGCADLVVAVVSTPPADPSLCRLPAVLWVDGHEVEIKVLASLSAPPFLLHRPPQASAQPVQRGPVLDRVGAAHGLTQQVREAGPPPVAAELARRAQLPGCRGGVGFAGGAARDPSPPSTAASAFRVQLPLADLHLPDPRPPDPIPLAEPLFGAAMEYLQEAADGLTQEELQQAVLAVRAANPTLYAANLGASRAGSLPRALTMALHLQARNLFGERAGIPAVIADAWDQPGEPLVVEARGEAPAAPPSEGGAAAMSEGGEGEGGEGEAEAEGAPAQHSAMAQPGSPFRSRPRGREPAAAQGGTPLRPSSRMHSPPGQWWVAQRAQPAPSSLPRTPHTRPGLPRVAAPHPPGMAAGGGGRQRQ